MRCHKPTWFERHAKAVWLTCVLAAVVACCFLIWAFWTHPAQAKAEKAANPGGQQVVWDTTKQGMPVHYVNTRDGAYYYTACDKQMYDMTSRSATIDIAQSEKKLICDDCRMALESYTKLRSVGDQRYIDTQKSKTLGDVVAEHKATEIAIATHDASQIDRMDAKEALAYFDRRMTYFEDQAKDVGIYVGYSNLADGAIPALRRAVDQNGDGYAISQCLARLENYVNAADKDRQFVDTYSHGDIKDMKAKMSKRAAK